MAISDYMNTIYNIYWDINVPAGKVHALKHLEILGKFIGLVPKNG